MTSTRKLEGKSVLRKDPTADVHCYLTVFFQLIRNYDTDELFLQRCFFLCETCDPEGRQDGARCKVYFHAGQEEDIRSERDEAAFQAGPRESALLS